MHATMRLVALAAAVFEVACSSGSGDSSVLAHDAGSDSTTPPQDATPPPQDGNPPPQDSSAPPQDATAIPDADVRCIPSCGHHNCGDDGCGGSCGTCPSGLACNGGYCGTTSGGWFLTWNDEFDGTTLDNAKWLNPTMDNSCDGYTQQTAM